MRLLALGGTRFVGRHLVEAALRRGLEVTLAWLRAQAERERELLARYREARG